MLRHFSRKGFFKFLISTIFLKILTKKCQNFDKKMPKKWFFGKKSLKKKLLLFFGQYFQKYCLIQKSEKKMFLELCFNMIFKQF